MRKICLFIFIIILGSEINAQTRIQGVVSDSKKQSLSGASISIKDSYDGGISDTTGHFSFITSEKGELIVVVSAVGYLPTEQKITLTTTLVSLTFSLKE